MASLHSYAQKNIVSEVVQAHLQGMGASPRVWGREKKQRVVCDVRPIASSQYFLEGGKYTCDHGLGAVHG